jgi:hypothetical protein
MTKTEKFCREKDYRTIDQNFNTGIYSHTYRKDFQAAEDARTALLRVPTFSTSARNTVFLLVRYLESTDES